MLNSMNALFKISGLFVIATRYLSVVVDLKTIGSHFNNDFEIAYSFNLDRRTRMASILPSLMAFFIY